MASIFKNRSENPLESLNKMGSFFDGSDPTTFADIELDPFNSGFSFIKWIKVPEWFEQNEKLKYFKVYTQKFMTSFNGFTDVELQESSQQYGFSGNDVPFVTGIQKGNTDFTIGFKEFSGTPLTKMFNEWINLIRDKNTGIALYPALYNVNYSARNHTAQLLYVSMRPDVTNVDGDNLEKAFIWANVFPINVAWSSLFNYELGSTESPTSIDVNFKGVMIEGDAVDDYARKIIKEEILNVSEDNNNGHLFLTSLTQKGDAGTEVLTQGLLKEIYNNGDEI